MGPDTYIIAAYYATTINCNSIKTDLFKTFDSLRVQDLNNYQILAGDQNYKHSGWRNPTNETILKNVRRV